MYLGKFRHILGLQVGQQVVHQLGVPPEPFLCVSLAARHLLFNLRQLVSNCFLFSVSNLRNLTADMVLHAVDFDDGKATIPLLDQWWTTDVNLWHQSLPDLKTINKPMATPNHSIQLCWCPRKSSKVCDCSKKWAKAYQSTVNLWTRLHSAVEKALYPYPFNIIILLCLFEMEYVVITHFLGLFYESKPFMTIAPNIWGK